LRANIIFRCSLELALEKIFHTLSHMSQRERHSRKQNISPYNANLGYSTRKHNKGNFTEDEDVSTLEKGEFRVIYHRGIVGFIEWHEPRVNAI
jgi:hypothetical protein